MESTTEQSNDVLNKLYSFIIGNNLLGTFISMSLILYGGLAGPKLPKVFKDLFEKDYFKFFILSLVAYSSTRDFKVSLLLAFAFIFSVSMFDNKQLREQFSDSIDNEPFINSNDCSGDKIIDDGNCICNQNKGYVPIDSLGKECRCVNMYGCD